MTSLVETSVGPVHHVDYGGSGPAIVLVHGLGGSVTNWDFLGPRLTSHGRVVALDLPGFGYSPPARDWELSTHAEAISSFARQMGPSFTLIGNSLGGLLGSLVASEHPGQVDNLIMIAPATPPRVPDPKIHWPTALRLLVQATPGVGTTTSRYLLSRYDSEELVRMTLESVAHEPSRIPPDMMRSFVEVAERRRSMPWAPRAVPETGNAIARLFKRPRDFVEIIRGVRAPTLVVQGVEDNLVSPTSVEWLCSLRPDWDLVQMEDTGHVPQLDAPVRLLGILDPWLTEHLMAQNSA